MLRTVVPVTVYGGGGATDVANVGTGGSVQGIQAAVTIHNPLGYVSVNVDDSADGGNRTATVDLQAVTGGSWSLLTGLAPAPIQMGDLGDLTVRTGTGTEVVNVLSTRPNHQTSLVGYSANTTVNVGYAGSVQYVLGTLSIINPPSYTHVNVNDSADATGRNVTLSGSGVTGIAPAAINFTTGSVNALSVTAGSGNDTVTLAGAPASSITLNGGGGTNTLIGPNAAAAWSITAPNAGNLGGGATTFSNFQNLTGGSANDVFNFSNGATLSGTLNGGGGINTLNESAYSTPVTVNLATGMATGVGGGVAGIQSYVGGSGNNTLIGPNADITWNLTGSNAGNLNGAITFTNFANLTGGSGSDTFVFANGAGVSGNLDGETGINMLDYGAYTTPVAVDLTAGAATGVGGTVANVVVLRGGQGNDTLNGNAAGTTSFLASPGTDTITGAGGTNTLQGTSTASTYRITAQNGGTLTFGSNTTTFSGIQNLYGGSIADDFILSDGAGVDGNVSGGAAGTLDYSAYTTPVTVNLAASTATGVGGHIVGLHFIGAGAGGNTLVGLDVAATWNVTGRNAGTLTGAYGYTFSGFQNLTGGAGNDTFVLANGAGVDGALDGGGGSNTLVGPNAAAAWAITSQNAGTITSGATTTFANVQNLLGGSGNDTFTLGDAAGVDGGINGGGGGNTLDESAYSTPVTVNLAANTATGVGATIANVQSFVGPGAGGTLTGPNTATTWNVTATDRGTLPGGIGFSGFGNLTGGQGADTFVLNNGAGVDGGINGGGGGNTLDESAYSTPVTIDLSANTASGIGGTFANLGRFVGSAAGGNTLNGPASNGTAYTFWGIINSNAGSINSLNGSFSFTSFQNLASGAGNNRFDFGNGASVSGTITGGSGTNTLNYGNYLTTVIVNLQTGSATGVGGGIGNVQNVVGGSGPGGYNLLVGNGGNVLTGGNNRRNLLIAGASASTLVGGNGEDLLIAGTTGYDVNAAALLDIMGVWSGAGTYQDRVNRLVNDGTYAFSLNGAVHGNGGGNVLRGKPGGSTALDLYFATVGDTTDATGADTVIGIV